MDEVLLWLFVLLTAVAAYFSWRAERTRLRAKFDAEWRALHQASHNLATGRKVKKKL